jgi:Meckel syndrome type 1 protein
MSLPALRLLPGADAPAPVPVRSAVPARAPALRLVVAWPAAPMPVVARPALTPFMRRCLLLAALLHVWLVLMLGNAPGGTAAPGQGVAGTLNITLRGPVTPGATQEVLPPAPAVPDGPMGTAAQPRWGGQVRSQAPTAAAEPGAAQLGRWAAEPGLAAAGGFFGVVSHDLP